ncbi:MAG: PD40 domain-containing protein [Bacteroidia bacterium]|nr:PD40 domain-containing protein [Bacteroidia bacterium]
MQIGSAQDSRATSGGVKNSKAEKLYNKRGYKASISEFLKSNKISDSDKLKIANAYRLNHETKEAEEWYAKVFEDSPDYQIKDPIHLLYYAQVLQSNGKESSSAKYYEEYTSSLKSQSEWDKVARVFSKNVTLTNRFPHTDIKLKNERFINTSKLEFSPAIYDNGIVYVTTQQLNSIDKSGKDPWLNDNFMSLMTARIGSDGLLTNPKAFSNELTFDYHEGPVSFSNNNTRIYFTMNHGEKRKKKSKSRYVRRLQIYSATWDGKKWKEPELLSFNTEENEEAHPAVSPDGKTMFFASNRPGGYGNMDIYVTYLEDDTWTDPVNLGPKVNTAGNEVFPFLHSNGMLFFSSNGHDGLGGLDILHTSVSFNGNWAKAINAGTPFNSNKDDFGLIMDETGDYGYLTSARDGGIGRDDIYSFDLDVSDVLPAKQLTLCVRDKETSTAMSDIGLRFLSFESIFSLESENQNSKSNYQIQPTEDGEAFLLVLDMDEILREPTRFYTNADGLVEVDIEPGMHYKFVAEAEGYQLGQLNISYDDPQLESKDYCIEMSKGSRNLNRSTELASNDVAAPIANESVTISNSTTNSNSEEVPEASNKSGSATSNTYSENTPEDHDIKSSSEKPTMAYGLDPADRGSDPHWNFSVLESEINAKKVGIDELNSEDIKVGNIIVLENIYYDFDEHYIRDDAQIELDKVVRLMKQFPEMIIELGSHTDARGADRYNSQLSTKRAIAAVDYLAYRGVSDNRIVAKGYGETQLRNSCSDGRQCSEEDHEFNRRTEVKVLHFPYQDVDLSYQDVEQNAAPVFDLKNVDTQESNDKVDDRKGVSLDQITEIYRVYVGSYAKVAGALKKQSKLNNKGFESVILEFPSKNLFRVSAGDFSSRDSAKRLVRRMKAAGLKPMIKTVDR